MANPLDLDLKLILVESDTMDFSVYELPRSLFDLQRLEASYVDKGFTVNFKYEDTKSPDRNKVSIRDFAEYEKAQKHMNIQGLVLIVEKENSTANLNRKNWKCKIDLSENPPEAPICKVCHRPRPPEPGRKKILD
jgi:hypothetical protein